MHGVIKPPPLAIEVEDRERWASVSAWARRNRAFLLLVIAPTVLVAAYYYLWASDQYQSEAHFVVRTSDTSPAVPSSFGQMLGLAGGGSQTHNDAMSVNDFLSSHDAVRELGGRINLVERFRRPEADIISRLWSSDPTPESLLKYYRKHVIVHFDGDNGITSLKVRMFRSEDSYAVIKELLRLGEQRVNFLNQRSRADTLSVAKRELALAEQGLATVQGRITSYRQQREDVDPTGSARAQIGLVSNLTGALVQAKAQLAAMSGIIAPSSPQYVAAASRVRALQAQVAGQSSRLVDGGSAIAANLGGYEDLQVRQQFAAKRYDAAAANLEKARDQATRQQLYIVRIVDPNLPVKSEFPERGRVVATVFFSLLLAYGIGWLIMAGVKEHSL
jgi:capsular polysaccharide transport system permease protein